MLRFAGLSVANYGYLPIASAESLVLERAVAMVRPRLKRVGRYHASLNPICSNQKRKLLIVRCQRSLVYEEPTCSSQLYENARK